MYAYLTIYIRIVFVTKYTLNDNDDTNALDICQCIQVAIINPYSCHECHASLPNTSIIYIYIYIYIYICIYLKLE